MNNKEENANGLKEGEELEDEADQNDASTSGTSSDGDNKKDDKTDASKKKERNFSQEQVNRMMTREKNQGRAAAFKELGLDPKDSKMMKMVQEFIESQKSDEQKNVEAEKRREEIEQRVLIAETKAEAMMLGVKPQYVDDVVTLALSKISDDTDLKTILGEFKERYVVWFEANDDDFNKNSNKAKIGQKGTGSSIKDMNKKGSDKETSGLGARLAAQRKSTEKSRNSFWNRNEK